MRRDGQARARIGSQAPAARLYQLEQEARRLSARLHRDRTRLTLVEDELRRLRVSFDANDAEQYRRLVFVKEGR
jgi:hypothetical protein